jgi:hypothetical protein
LKYDVRVIYGFVIDGANVHVSWLFQVLLAVRSFQLGCLQIQFPQIVLIMQIKILINWIRGMHILNIHLIKLDVSIRNDETTLLHRVCMNNERAKCTKSNHALCTVSLPAIYI